MIQKFPSMCIIYGQIFAIGLYVRALKVCVCVCVCVCISFVYSFFTWTVRHGQWSTYYLQVMTGLFSAGHHWELSSVLEWCESFVDCNPITSPCPCRLALTCCTFIQMSHSAVHRTSQYIKYIWTVTAQCAHVCHTEKTVTKINK